MKKFLKESSLMWGVMLYILGFSLLSEGIESGELVMRIAGYLSYVGGSVLFSVYTNYVRSNKD